MFNQIVRIKNNHSYQKTTTLLHDMENELDRSYEVKLKWRTLFAFWILLSLLLVFYYIVCKAVVFDPVSKQRHFVQVLNLSTGRQQTRQCLQLICKKSWLINSSNLLKYMPKTNVSKWVVGGWMNEWCVFT